MKKILLLLANGFEAACFYEEAFSEPFQRVSQYFDLHQKPTASVCVASLMVAQSGVYKVEKLTTYNHPTRRRLEQLKQYGVQAVDQRIVLDRNSIASSNPDTAFDVAFMLLEIGTSIKNMKRVEELMGLMSRLINT